MRARNIRCRAGRGQAEWLFYTKSEDAGLEGTALHENLKEPRQGGHESVVSTIG
jgi:hypothetical protein